jgi:hypothetical protein
VLRVAFVPLAIALIAVPLAMRRRRTASP